MAGPINIDPSKPPRHDPQFGTATHQDVQPFLGIMTVLREPTVAPSFTRLITGRLEEADQAPLAHLFEEICTLAQHRLIAEDLLFDAFAIDLYWDRLSRTVEQVRRESGNGKFCENFERVADVARAYRERRPHKQLATA